MKKYSNLADSIHFNPSASYFGGHFSQRANELKKELTQILNSNDTIAFSLNQIADNPIFYLQTRTSEELFDLLIRLFEKDKAFISTYNNYDVWSYAQKNMISSFRRICDDQTDDSRFVSSITEALANIKGDVDQNNEMIVHYSDRAKRNVHKALFGIDRLVTICDGNVTWTSHKKYHSVPIEEYLIDMRHLSEEKTKYGYYTGNKKDDEDTECKNTPKFFKNMGILRGSAKYRPNDPFVRDNDISLSTVTKHIIQTDDILEQIFTETIDTTIEKRLKAKKLLPDFLNASREAFTNLSNLEGLNRSKMYEHAFSMMNTYFKPALGYTDNNWHKNAIYKLITPYVFQTIDIIYNYFNFLQVFGVQDNTSFTFYSFYTQHGMPGAPDNTHKGIISLNKRQNESLFKDKICYYVLDDNNTTLGSYLKYEYASKKFNELQTNGTKCHITDKNGSILC